MCTNMLYRLGGVSNVYSPRRTWLKRLMANTIPSDTRPALLFTFPNSGRRMCDWKASGLSRFPKKTKDDDKFKTVAFVTLSSDVFGQSPIAAPDLYVMSLIHPPPLALILTFFKGSGTNTATKAWSDSPSLSVVRQPPLTPFLHKHMHMYFCVFVPFPHSTLNAVI